MDASATDTIAAQATPHGHGGVGIIRISGPLATQIAQQILGKLPRARYADYVAFKDEHADLIDKGIALFFAAPHSFTGEDSLELHAHGGPIVMARLLQTVLRAGARLAKPGEFTQRAFLNDKIDLVQAEAIADLIAARSQQAARSALRSLQGDFSRVVHQLVASVTKLRVWVEACIDFPEEEIDFLAQEQLQVQLKEILLQVTTALQMAEQGVLLRDGMTVVIAGKPNVGKSSLLNQLSGRESAIVTAIAGTTRDVVREYINLDGIPLHVVDTAGLHESVDIVEQEGMRRAKREIQQADIILCVYDGQVRPPIAELVAPATQLTRVWVKNKIDLTGESSGKAMVDGETVIQLSAKHGCGVEVLRDHLTALMGYQHSTAGTFSARRRHVEALARAQKHLRKSYAQLCGQRAGELLAEDLRLAQQALSEITGEFTADDLLGEIFSSFCIGK